MKKVEEKSEIKCRTEINYWREERADWKRQAKGEGCKIDK